MTDRELLESINLNMLAIKKEIQNINDRLFKLEATTTIKKGHTPDNSYIGVYRRYLGPSGYDFDLAKEVYINGCKSDLNMLEKFLIVVVNYYPKKPIDLCLKHYPQIIKNIEPNKYKFDF